MKETDHLRGPLILCIDDDAASLQLRREILNRQGYAVIAASVPGDGLQAFLTQDVALVMADSLLRGGNGIHLARQMKRAKPKVPIVMVSGDPPEHLGHVDCYINKAEPIPQMLGIIQGLLTRASH